MNKKLKIFLIVTGVVTTCFSNSVLAQITQIPENMEGRTFKEARHQMHNIFEKLYHPQTLYCGCDVAFNRFWYFPNLQSCGYQCHVLHKTIPLMKESLRESYTHSLQSCNSYLY